MSEELGREPTDEELSEEIGISRAKLSQLKTVSIRPASLEAPIGDDDSSEFGEIVGDEDAHTPFELFRDKNMHDELSELGFVTPNNAAEAQAAIRGLAGKPSRVAT